MTIPIGQRYLGSVASSVNSQCGRRKYEVPLYNAVFGCSYHQDVNVTKEEARWCWTIDEQIKVSEFAMK